MIHYLSILAIDWSKRVFAEHFPKITHKIRVMRLLEEVLELAQAEGVDTGEVATIVNQVFVKRKGDPEKEFGAVMVTIAAYAGQKGINLEQVCMQELERIQDPQIMARVLQRNLYGDKIGFQKI